MAKTYELTWVALPKFETCCFCLKNFWGYIDRVIEGWSFKVMGEGDAKDGSSLFL
jgi:hypothetical protein